jgi:hypothetical protein
MVVELTNAAIGFAGPFGDVIAKASTVFMPHPRRDIGRGTG